MMRLAAILACAATCAQAEDTPDAFIEANLISIFYHELGHALIDVMELPVFGQEEDAADTASILLIDATFDTATATDIAYDAALGFAAEANATGDDIEWSDVHGADLQRYYNLVCLFYGADPNTRDDFAADMGLPQERAEGCEEEYDLAESSWGPVFDDLVTDTGRQSLIYTGATDSLTEMLISTEVAALNAHMELPVDISIIVESCDEANAFYDPETRSITICSEFETHLRDISPVQD